MVRTHARRLFAFAVGLMLLGWAPSPATAAPKPKKDGNDVSAAADKDKPFQDWSAYAKKIADERRWE